MHRFAFSDALVSQLDERRGVAAYDHVVIAEAIDSPGRRVQDLAILSGVAGFDVRHVLLRDLDDLARAAVADRERQLVSFEHAPDVCHRLRVRTSKA